MTDPVSRRVDLFPDEPEKRDMVIPLEGPLLTAVQRFAPEHTSTKNGILIARYRTFVVKIDDAIVVKYGTIVKEREAEVMKFIKENMSVPVPRVLGTLTEDGTTFIVMEFIRGEMISSVWPELSDTLKTSLAMEMRSYLDEMRSFQAPYIGSFGRKPCESCFLQPPFDGPFDSEQDMNKAVISACGTALHDRMVRKMLRDDHPIMFTHGDLNMRNILVRDGHIVALLDWEDAGFYPEYWEYACMRASVDWETSTIHDWGVFVDICLTPHYVQEMVFRILSESLLY